MCILVAHILRAAGVFLSNMFIFRPKLSIIGRKEMTLDERSSHEIV